MRYRVDLLTLYTIDFTNFIIDDNNLLYIPNLADCLGINDFMSIGTMGAIEKYCNLFLQYKDLILTTNFINSNEKILQTYLHRINIRILRFPFECMIRESIWTNRGGNGIKLSETQITELKNTFYNI